MKITLAARKVNLNVSTAKFLVKQYKKNHPVWAGPVKVVPATPHSSATEEDNGTQQTVQQNSLSPYYFPFYPSTPYPWMPVEGNGNPFFNLYYPSH
jgi:hypothetical protein